MKRDFLTILDLSFEEIDALLRRASTLKEDLTKGVLKATLTGKTLGLIFDKPSTRTRVSFEVAMYQLGGRVIFMSSQDTQLSRDEPLRDTALVLSRYIEGLVLLQILKNHLLARKLLLLHKIILVHVGY